MNSFLLFVIPLQLSTHPVEEEDEEEEDNDDDGSDSDVIG